MTRCGPTVSWACVTATESSPALCSAALHASSARFAALARTGTSPTSAIKSQGIHLIRSASMSPREPGQAAILRKIRVIDEETRTHVPPGIESTGASPSSTGGS
jgi:hypothetical protein